jgi:GntR family transcriptional repressor for pyruvate dehydrogenase complex
MDSEELVFEQFKRSNISDLAMSSLLDLIRRRVLKPGDRLPSQRDLVNRMGVSQTAVREALRSLASIGVIEVHPGRGAFVSSISPDMLVRPESFFFLLQRESLLQAIEVRRILEVEAIALASERATDEDLADLKAALDRIETGLRSDEKPFQQSPYFHVAIAKATHNMILANMVESFAKLMMEGAQVIAANAPDSKEKEYSSHALLFDAILKKDPENARNCMREHLALAKDLISRGFAEFS